MYRKLSKTKKFYVLALSAGLILFLIVAWKSNPASLLKTLQKFTLWHFIAITATFLLQLLFSTISISLIVKKLNHGIALRHTFPLQLIKFSISYVTPFSNNGGEPLQIYLLKKKHKVLYSKGATAVILEALLKLAVSMIFITIGSLYFLITTHVLALKILLCLVLFLFLFLLILFFYCTIKKRGFLTILGTYFGFKRIRLFQTKRKIINNIDKCTIHFLHNHKRAFVLTLLLAFLTMACYLLRFYLILAFLGYAPAGLDLILVFALTQALILIPVPTLLGIHEAGQSLLSLITTIPLETGVSFVIILRVVSLLFTIPGFILLGHHSLNSVGKNLLDRIFFNLNNKIKNNTTDPDQ